MPTLAQLQLASSWAHRCATRKSDVDHELTGGTGQNHLHDNGGADTDPQQELVAAE